MDKDKAFETFVDRNKIIVTDALYGFNQTQYEEFLKSRPWVKE